jgi:CheY-like chemotaxis protein
MLVVDDDSVIHAILIRLLASFPGTVLHARDGHQALAIARRAKPDLLLTDALLPGVDGRVVAKTLKLEAPTSAMRIVVMSGLYKGIRYRNEAFREFHADAYLDKPVTAASLAEVIEKTLHVRLGAAAPAIPQQLSVKRTGWMTALIWGVLVCGGSLLLMRFETRPSDDGHVPSQWPAQSRIGRAADQPIVIMFLHPNCPCSRASVHELTAVINSLPPRLMPRIEFVLRTEAIRDWRASELRHDLSSIREAIVIDDDGGREAARFGAQTSGLVLLYDRSGALRFHGGITAGRGHEGANCAEDSLAGILRNSSTAISETPVYGCSLELAQRHAAKGANACLIQ